MAPRILFFCMLSCFLSGMTYAQEIKLKKGGEFIFEFQQTVTNGANSVFLYNVYAFKVIEKDPLGNYLLEGKLLAAREKSESERWSFIFDSDSIRNTKFNTTAALNYLAMLQQPFAVTLSPKGKVLDVNGMEDILKKAADKWELKKDLSEKLIHNATAAEAIMQGFFVRLPAGKKLKTGLEWSNSQDSMRYRVTASGEAYTITSPEGGNYKLDRKTLLPLSYTREFEMKATDTGPPARGSAKINRLSAYDVPAEMDTAWVNMAATISYWSTRLKTRGEYDSLKVMRFIKKYGKLYAADPVYADNALALLQQVDSYEEYYRMLASTPTSLLIESSSHLHNKLQDLYGSNAKAAFEILKIMNQRYPESLYGWVQHSFCQAFLDDQRNPDRRKTVSELLDMCMHDPEKSLRRQFAPLNVWVSAKADKNNGNALKKAVAEIHQMDNEYWKGSNLGRYALLTSQLLDEAGDSVQAGKLLNYTLLRLEETVNDSLNKHQLAHRNMLAHAYFLKHQDALSTDSAAALKYLEKAADYSPKSSAEKARGSFYDRVFLRSKESYQTDYMNALSRLGRTHAALAAIVAEFNANPSVLPKLKDFYQSSFPDKDFKIFFAKEIVSKWNEAPAFTLVNLDDQPVSLKNYAGKWLVIDFWGTWCGPCKEEMPEINSFYQKIKKGAIPGVDFLSIACRDTKEKVVSYLKANNFTLPAVMSDGKIQKLYKVRGYPTKVLISPDGYMKILDFGAKWETIVAQFNSVYPGKTAL